MESWNESCNVRVLATTCALNPALGQCARAEKASACTMTCAPVYWLKVNHNFIDFFGTSILELLEEAEEEMAENIALPIAIVLMVGFLGTEYITAGFNRW